MIWPVSVYSNKDSKCSKINLKDFNLLMLGVFSSKVIFLHIGSITPGSQRTTLWMGFFRANTPKFDF